MLSMTKSNYLHFFEIAYTKGMKQKIPIAVRPSEAEIEILKKAAELESIPALAAYVRRAAVLYTREHHPELFGPS